MTLPHPYEVETHELEPGHPEPIAPFDLPGHVRDLVRVADDHTLDIAGVVLIAPLESISPHRVATVEPRTLGPRGTDPRRSGVTAPEAMATDPHRTAQRFREAITARFYERRPHADAQSWEHFVTAIQGRLRTFDTAGPDVLEMILRTVDGL